jgi:chemotaxis protein CheX
MLNLSESIVNATKEIFETMIMMELTPGEPLQDHVTEFNRTVSGVIGLAGTCKGMVAIHAPYAISQAITSNFLGMDVTEINEDVTDAIGELANMLAGNIKMDLDKIGKDVTVSIPSCIHGEAYSIDSIAESECATVPFTTAEGQFLVELQIVCNE